MRGSAGGVLIDAWKKMPSIELEAKQYVEEIVIVVGISATPVVGSCGGDVSIDGSGSVVRLPAERRWCSFSSSVVESATA